MNSSSRRTETAPARRTTRGGRNPRHYRLDRRNPWKEEWFIELMTNWVHRNDRKRTLLFDIGSLDRLRSFQANILHGIAAGRPPATVPGFHYDREPHPENTIANHLAQDHVWRDPDWSQDGGNPAYRKKMRVRNEELKKEPIRWDKNLPANDRCPKCGQIGMAAPRNRVRVCTGCGTKFTLIVPPNRWLRTRNIKGQSTLANPVLETRSSGGKLYALFEKGAELAKKHAPTPEFEPIIMEILEELKGQ